MAGAPVEEPPINSASCGRTDMLFLGIDSLAVLRQNLAVARGFTPMPPADMGALRDRCAASAANGHLELYKLTKRCDGAVGREQHGYPPPSELLL